MGPTSAPCGTIATSEADGARDAGETASASVPTTYGPLSTRSRSSRATTSHPFAIPIAAGRGESVRDKTRIPRSMRSENPARLAAVGMPSWRAPVSVRRRDTTQPSSPAAPASGDL